MPCDNRFINVCNAECESTLNDVEVLVNMYEGHQFILCGDSNTSFERNNAQTKCLINFMEANHKLCLSLGNIIDLRRSSRR